MLDANGALGQIERCSLHSYSFIRTRSPHPRVQAALTEHALLRPEQEGKGAARERGAARVALALCARPDRYWAPTSICCPSVRLDQVEQMDIAQRSRKRTPGHQLVG